MAEKMSVDNNDPVKDDSEESIGSSPEADPSTSNHAYNSSHNHGYNPASAADGGSANQEGQQPKRKGGRKPIYATSEERKQRNRQAQAAFRERRTEYIKQLEETIRVHEQNLHNLQGAHRHAADECLMLRYKNSLLERILLEKGIDVQAELRAKTGSPNLGPTHVPQNLVQPPPIQRAMINRHHARRSNSSIAPKLEPGITLPPLTGASQSGRPHSTSSPKSRPTPSSHSASPTTTSFGSQHVASPAGTGPEGLVGQIRQPPPPASAAMASQASPRVGGIPGMSAASAAPSAPSGPTHPGGAAVGRQAQMAGSRSVAAQSRVGAGVGPASFYPPPAFQNHMEQLEQEYDVAADMIDESAETPGTPGGPGPYPASAFADEPQPMALSSPVTTAPPGGQPIHGGQSSVVDGLPHSQHGSYPSMSQLLDPALDWDPFGLSASMAFPSQFSFDTSNMR